MNATLASSRQFLLGVLPYPDLRRRRRIRRKALRLVTCKNWPGGQATGMDAAQIALLRLLWLQELIRDAVTQGRGDDAALLARASLETCIVGLYCVHSGDSIADMSTSTIGAATRDSYLSAGDLGSTAAIDGAVEALGEVGPDLNVRDLALWLEREHGLAIAARLYYEHYVPLSHLFSHAYAFALLRHVDPDGTIRSRPAFPWAKRSAVRLADGCTGLLAGHIADQSGTAAERFHDYSAAHFSRLLTPAAVFAVKAAIRSCPRRKRLGALKDIFQARSQTRDPGVGADDLRDEFPGFLDTLVADMPADGTFAQPAAGYLTELIGPGDEEWQARHRRPAG